MENIVVESHNGFAPVFYIIVAVIVAVLVSIVFLIKKKNFNFNQLVKIFGKSLIITLIINFILFVFLYFSTSTACKPGAHCPSVSGYIFSNILIYSTPFIFLTVTLISLILKKNKDNNQIS